MSESDVRQTSDRFLDFVLFQCIFFEQIMTTNSVVLSLPLPYRACSQSVVIHSHSYAYYNHYDRDVCRE